MPRVSKDHLDARRRQILDAAAECFAREGVHRTTMQDVIREAGLSAGAIYRYFASKEAIVEALATERHARERALLGASTDATSPRAALRAIARAFFLPLDDARARKERRVGIQLWAEALRHDGIRALVRRGADEPRARLAALVRAGQRRGDLPRALDPDAAARAMLALFHGFVLQQAWDPSVEVAPYLKAVNSLLDGWSPPRPRRRRR